MFYCGAGISNNHNLLLTLKFVSLLFVERPIKHRKGSSAHSCSDSKSTSSSISTNAIKLIVEKLRTRGTRESTQQTYHSVWRQFNEFFIQLDEKPNNWEDRLVLFVGFLIEQKKKSSTIKSYISAIKNVLRDDGIHISENRYLLQSLTKACKLQNDRVRTRLPIHKDLLNLLVKRVIKIHEDEGQSYLATLYGVMFAAAYYGLLRVGEITMGTHCVLAKDVHIADN